MQKQQSHENSERPFWRIALRPLLALLRFLTAQVEKLASSEQPPELAPAEDQTPVDEETKALLQELRLLPSQWQHDLFGRWWLPWVMLTPVVVLFLLALTQDVYLYLNEWRARGVPFHLDNAIFGLDVIYVSFAIMFMAIVWLFARYSRLTPAAIRGLWDNGLLISTTETTPTNGSTPAAQFLRRYQNALASRWRHVIMVGAFLFTDAILLGYLSRQFSPSFESFLATTTTLFIVCKWFLFPQVWLWIVVTIGWPPLVTAYYLRRLTADFDLEVVPSHPDKCGGLKPIGDICLQMALIALVASLILSYWGTVGSTMRASGILPTLQTETSGEEILNPTREPQPITQVLADMGMLAGTIGGAALFFYPMSGIRGDMKKKKDGFAQELADVATEYDRELEKAIKARDEKQIKAAQSKLETLQKANTLLQDYPVWPLNWGIFLRYFTPQLFSVLGLFLSFNAEKLQTILKWLGLLGEG